MAVFKQFKPQALQRIAKSFGYLGDMGGFKQYLEDNPNLKTRMQQLEDSASTMAKNGIVKIPRQTQEQTPNTIHHGLIKR